MNAAAIKAIAEASTKAAAQANGAWVKHESPVGTIEACSIKKHVGGKPFASYVTNYRLNGKRIAVANLVALFDAVP